MTSIKILQIIRGLDIGGDSGGAELFGVKLARELNNLPKCEVWICAFFSVGTDTELMWLETLNNEGIKTFFVTEWGGYNNLRKFTKGLLNLLKRAKKEKFDVAHSHFQLGSLVAVILKWLGLSKTSYRTAHIRKEWDYGRWTWILSPVFMKRIFPSYLDGEIGVSKAVCEYLYNRRPGKIKKSKIHLIYNGIDINTIERDSKEQLSEKDKALFENRTPVIGCVGRLAEQKGYPYILGAMTKIISRYPDCLLQIVGEGELRDELSCLVEDLNLAEHVVFLGLRNDVPALMLHWDVFVLPSLWEGFPTVVMEAMICEVPVIATDIPGTNELVFDEETGLLVLIKDPDSIFDAIVKIVDDPPLRHNLTIKAKNHAEKFSMENIAKNYYQLYKEILIG
jgi:glycosyltransferase involved in cell wall biosynthesis